MLGVAEQELLVTGGVDTHADMHVAAAVDQVGRVLGTTQFPAAAAGYRAALAMAPSPGLPAAIPKKGPKTSTSQPPGPRLARQPSPP